MLKAVMATIMATGAVAGMLGAVPAQAQTTFYYNQGYACPQGSMAVQGYDGTVNCVIQNYIQQQYQQQYQQNYGNYGYSAPQERRLPPPPGGFTPGLGANAQNQLEEQRHEERALKFQVPSPQQQQQNLQWQHPLPPGGYRP